jgi:hypothetical protein
MQIGAQILSEANAMNAIQRKEEAAISGTPSATTNDLGTANALDVILFDENLNVANLPESLKQVEENLRSGQESVKSAGLASLDDPQKVDCLLPWVIRSLNDRSKRIRIQACGILGDRYYISDDSVEGECLAAICEYEDGSVRLAPIRKLVTLLDGMHEALFPFERLAMDMRSNPSNPLAQPPIQSLPVPGHEPSNAETPQSEAQERIDRIKRYASAEFTRQLLEHMHKAKKAAILQSREQPEK